MYILFSLFTLPHQLASVPKVFGSQKTQESRRHCVRRRLHKGSSIWCRQITVRFCCNCLRSSADRCNDCVRWPAASVGLLWLSHVQIWRARSRIRGTRHWSVIPYFALSELTNKEKKNLLSPILDHAILGFLLRLCCHFHCLVSTCFTLFYVCRRGTSWIQQAIPLLVLY